MTKLTISLCGGLGNQLFQIFSLLSHARKLNCDYIIEKIDKSPSITPRNIYWNKLLVNLNYESVNKLSFEEYYERNNNIYQDLPNFTKDTILNGYFQSEKYLQEIRRDLYNYIKLDEDDNKNVLTIYQDLRKKAADKSIIFIHVRRGDYVKLANIHYNLPQNYYENALSHFDTSLHHFVIFSDDIEYSKNIFQNLPHKDFIDLEDYLCLYLMSLLDGAIIANSTFSWWGAYLLELRKELYNEHSPKIIQPARWFTQGGILPNDRIVKRRNWIVIE